MKNYLDKARTEFFSVIAKKNLLDEQISIEARVLTPEESIGHPERDDFPLLKGKERIIEAKFKKSIGHVFTDSPGFYKGTLQQILNRPLKNNFDRAILIASINAVMRHLGLIKGTIHCKDNEPEKCAKKLAAWLIKHYPDRDRIALLGFQPAFIETLLKEFSLNVLDLDKDNLGEKYGIHVFNSLEFYQSILRWADMALVTGTVFVNGTIENIARAKPLQDIIFYGVTVSGLARLLDLKRVCFCSK
ncbi:MAG: hypothetical protein JW827_05335 [Spirochaetes bacterium]|nr:hypothetical protein [Spirochaetota bacterium]